jgi:hypothetical protein
MIVTDFSFSHFGCDILRLLIQRHRSEWPRALRHELFSTAQTLRSWVGIPLEARLSVCVYVVQRGLPHPWSPALPCIRWTMEGLYALKFFFISCKFTIYSTNWAISKYVIRKHLCGAIIQWWCCYVYCTFCCVCVYSSSSLWPFKSEGHCRFSLRLTFIGFLNSVT